MSKEAISPYTPEQQAVSEAAEYLYSYYTRDHRAIAEDGDFEMYEIFDPGITERALANVKAKHITDGFSSKTYDVAAINIARKFGSYDGTYPHEDTTQEEMDEVFKLIDGDDEADYEWRESDQWSDIDDERWEHANELYNRVGSIVLPGTAQHYDSNKDTFYEVAAIDAHQDGVRLNIDHPLHNPDQDS